MVRKKRKAETWYSMVIIQYFVWIYYQTIFKLTNWHVAWLSGKINQLTFTKISLYTTNSCCMHNDKIIRYIILLCYRQYKKHNETRSYNSQLCWCTHEKFAKRSCELKKKKIKFECSRKIEIDWAQSGWYFCFLKREKLSGKFPLHVPFAN